MFLVDPSSFLMILVAMLTILYGSYRSLSFYKTFSISDDDKEESNLKTRTAIILPIVGSIFLVVLFYLLNWIYYLLLAILAFASLSGVTFLVYPGVVYLLNRFNKEKSWEMRWVGTVTLSGITSILIGVVLVTIWLVFRTNEKAIILTDFMALALATTSLSSIRIPNLKIAAITLSLFFLYDIFWVFLSPLIFKKNVMETVARGLPDLPMVIYFPRFLDDGASLLGLGDIVLPGLFLCFLYRFDQFNHTPFKYGYFLRAWIAYGLGLVMTLVMLWVLQRGQPALLYLVPFTMLTTVFFGWRRQQLEDLWKGLYKVEDLEKFAQMQEASSSSSKSNNSNDESQASLLQNQELSEMKGHNSV